MFKLFNYLFSKKKIETTNVETRPKITYHSEGIINVNMTSNVQYIGESIENKSYKIKCEKISESPKIYELSIYNNTDGISLLEPVTMKVYEFEFVKATLRGLYKTDPHNFHKKESSHLYLQVILDFTGNVGTATFYDESIKKSIVFQ